jgi:HSP20 family molecular chaperone IbpA
MATSRPAPSSKIFAAPRIVGESDKERFDQALHRRVSERAYRLYESSGWEHGNHHAHWLQAQNEVLQRGLEIRESGSWLSINAALPGVEADNIEVYLEPTRVIVRAEKSESNQDSETREISQQEIFLLQDLDTEVDPATASAAFKDQKLTLMVKKRYPMASGTPIESTTRS